MDGEDIHYLLFCEGTLLREEVGDVQFKWKEHRAALEIHEKSISNAMSQNDTAAVAMASVRYNHAIVQMGVAKTISYTLDDSLASLVLEEMVGRYRIGIVTSNKAAATKALGPLADKIDVLMEPDELENNSIYFSDYSVIVMKDSMAKVLMPGVDYVHPYKDAHTFKEYLDDPKLSWNYADPEEADQNSPYYLLVFALFSLVMIGVIILLYLGMKRLLA